MVLKDGIHMTKRVLVSPGTAFILILLADDQQVRLDIEL